ncbi:MAG: succinate dehydrogenase, hydrophobic membrane anchor protein [Rickettsiales bacterium]|nr:MAG: succinate dehydrogenase, hydrophobic membrane anchor protein [Rickettsiales bacterium]
MENKFKSDLSLAKNLGSAAHGSMHWWHQRVTGLFLAIATIWFFCFSWEISASEMSGVVEVIKKPWHVVMLSLFVLAAFYHSVLGMQVVIEDYVHSRAWRVGMLLVIQIFSIVTAAALIVAALYVMTL